MGKKFQLSYFLNQNGEQPEKIQLSSAKHKAKNLVSNDTVFRMRLATQTSHGREKPV